MSVLTHMDWYRSCFAIGVGFIQGEWTTTKEQYLHGYVPKLARINLGGHFNRQTLSVGQNKALSSHDLDSLHNIIKILSDC